MRDGAHPPLCQVQQPAPPRKRATAAVATDLKCSEKQRDSSARSLSIAAERRYCRASSTRPLRRQTAAANVFGARVKIQTCDSKRGLQQPSRIRPSGLHPPTMSGVLACLARPCHTDGSVLPTPLTLRIRSCGIDTLMVQVRWQPAPNSLMFVRLTCLRLQAGCPIASFHFKLLGPGT